jgi:hypothetical protein
MARKALWAVAAFALMYAASVWTAWRWFLPPGAGRWS